MDAPDDAATDVKGAHAMHASEEPLLPDIDSRASGAAALVGTMPASGGEESEPVVHPDSDEAADTDGATDESDRAPRSSKARGTRGGSGRKRGPQARGDKRKQSDADSVGGGSTKPRQRKRRRRVAAAASDDEVPPHLRATPQLVVRAH